MEQIAKGVWKISYGVPEEHTPVSMRKSKICFGGLDQVGKAADETMPDIISNLTCQIRRRGVTVTCPMDSDEDIYGFGLQLLSTNYAGRRRYTKVNSDPRMDTGESHAPVPFYISTAGYGLFVDTYRYVTFSMGTNAQKGASAQKKEVNQSHEEFSESALYALKKSNETRRVMIDIPSAEGVDIYIFAGNILEVVQRYNLFSGGGCLPPMWGLGIWYRAYGGCDGESLVRLADSFREDHIPVDVIGIEPGWHSHSYSCTFDWSYLFPEPDAMLKSLQEKDFHVNLWEHAFVYPVAQIYDSLQDYSGDYEVWNGLVPDLSLSEAQQVFKKWHQEHLIDKGVTGFKLDECDNSDFNPSNWSFPDASQFPSGMDGEQMHSAIGVLYQQMMEQAFREKNIRTLSQVRSSGALAAPLPFVLYSDLYRHEEFIRGVVTAPFSGMLWSPEVRDCVNGEDLLRRMQTVCFSAQALINSWRIPSPPWKQTDIEKNLAGIEMEEAKYYTDACRRIFELRMSLLPYLYSAFVEYYQKGIPPIRPLCMEYPHDLRVRNIDDEYFFGKDMVVCPITMMQKGERKGYLPEGKWYDLFSGEEITGGKQFHIKADVEKIPVYVRDGAVVPFAEPVQCVRKDTVFHMHVRHYGKEAGSFVLYEDDFTSYDYEGNGFRKIQILVDETGQKSILGIEACKKYLF